MSIAWMLVKGSEGHSLVPVLFGDSVKRPEHQRQDDLAVLLDQTQNIFIIPEIQSPLCNLTYNTHRE